MSDFDLTDEQRDDLASAYLDGVATAAEVARVDADPELLDLVATMRDLREQLSSSAAPTADDITRTRHLKAAMALYDQLPTTTALTTTASTTTALTTTAPAGAATSIPSTDPAGQRSNDDDTIRSLDEHRALRAVPRWLSTAAVAMVALGGLGFALQQVSGGADDTTDAAEERVSASATAAEESLADDAAADDGDAADTAAAPQSDELLETDVMELEEGAVEEESGDEAMEDSATADDGEQADQDTAAVPLPVTADDVLGQFPADTPIDEIVAELRPSARAPESSFCVLGALEAGEVFDDEPSGVPVASIPVLIGEELVEIVVLELGDGTESAIVIDTACLPAGS